MEQILSIALLIVAGLVIILLFFQWVRSRIHIKVLTEENLSLSEELAEKRKTISYMVKTIPSELYQTVIKEKGGKVDYIAFNQPYAILNMNTEHFTDHIHTMDANQTFEVMNGLLRKTVPYIYQRNGVIVSFDKAGFKALFRESCEDTLVAAISISEILSQAAQSSDLYEDFAVGISYGTVLTGLAGTQERVSLVTVSEYESLAKYLQSIARKYDSRLLITASFRNRIESFEKKFHARRIGYVYITATQSLEELFDVFDGDSIAIKNHKQRTKLAFERGVKEYAEGEYEAARRYFIEVFKTNRYDKASKEYLRRCEQKLGKRVAGSLEPQIETF